ncbi:MAG: DUF4352 domain-containing protein [Patulibacter sp.]|nr:DUF4352 domain-containing protein [Patulibacter sp.]
MAVGSIGTWVTAGPWSVAGTTGGGDGWITLAIAAALGVLIAVRRVPWLALPGGIIAGGIGLGDAIHFLSGNDSTNEWFSISIGWGLVLVIVASASLAVWGATALPGTPARQRVIAGVLTVLAFAGAVALGVVDRAGNDGNSQDETALSDAADDPSGDNAEPADWDTSTETEQAEPATGGDSETNAPDASADGEADAADEAGDRKVTRIGKAATDDDMTFKVESFDRVSSVPVSEFSDPITGDDDAAFYIATVTWKNNTSTSARNFCGDRGAVLVDGEYRNFDIDDRTIDVADGGTCEDVQPGFKATVKLLFQMPDDAEPDMLALWNSDAPADPQRETYIGVDLRGSTD